jgi:hypothetical protein
MFGVLWRFRANLRRMPALTVRIEKDLLPLVAVMPGFVSNRVMRCGPSVLILLSVFADERAAEEAAAPVDWWIGANLRPLLSDLANPVIGRVHQRRVVELAGNDLETPDLRRDAAGVAARSEANGRPPDLARARPDRG